MGFQTVFKRYELKYMLTNEQMDRVLEAIMPYVKIDKYGKTTIRNLYFDTDNYRLIRRSIEKPDYKEKMRVRAYEQATEDSIVFVELKKKCEKVVYKRRVPMNESQAFHWLKGGEHYMTPTQITEEIDYFRDYYGNLHPTVFLAYDRIAYYAADGSGFRITFDDNILCREHDLSLQSEVYGTPILPEGKVMMELKCSGGIPLWMTEILSREKLYKTSFSKYGTAYQNIIYNRLREGKSHA
ncbi:MAG: polyphosphate polymerase domain-containing protein [Agathobacter sp.]|nr:polyphosphate polymerase domain-containing protein [Lachnospiraceae bacterium]MBR3812123.1 polyphosphate polymerase domain-containing protein [Agathobacter sp.]